MRPRFPTERGGRPPLVCSLSDSTEIDTICTIRNALYDGADAFLLHMERLDPACLNEETLRRIFDRAAGKPVLTLDYRSGQTEEEIAEIVEHQLTAVRAGAACIDMTADMFRKSDPQMAWDDETAARQREYIRKIHDMGAQVLASCHLWKFNELPELMRIALELQARGADFVKFAMQATTHDEMVEACRETNELSKALDVPLLFIAMGDAGRATRAIAPVFGSCMILCVQRYTPNGQKDKPILRATRELYNNFLY